MRALVFGGTAFLGRHVVDDLLARGHEVTLFRRGLSNPGAFPGVEAITGDRGGSLDALRDRRWDVVLDPSGYEPRQVRAAARAVAHDDVHYVFVSTISVYADLTRAIDEASPVHALDGTEDDLELSPATYGRMKVACERAAEEALPGRVQSVRAGLILGPHDYDERFPWWLRRLARGGEVIAPGEPDAPVQFVDVRDLAAWMVDCAERRTTGIFNATGPESPMPMRELLETLREVTGGGARLTWVPDDVLLAHQVQPASELPFWLPAAYASGFRVDVARAVAAGLRYRPLVETARDTCRWLATEWERERDVREHRTLRVPAGISAEREAAVLAQARG